MTTPPQNPDEIGRHDLARATGRARGGVDNAEGATRHAARQIVLALAQGGHEHPDLGIDSRYQELEAAAKVTGDADDEPAIGRLLVDLGELHDDAMKIHAAAEAVRRGLPRVYGDPLNLARDWPT
jgi:hypothetical protein